jgi:hypothetical protein
MIYDLDMSKAVREYFNKIEKENENDKVLVCCSTCHNNECKNYSMKHEECLTLDSRTFWSEEMGYLPKMHEYSYTHWVAPPHRRIKKIDFITEEEFSL